jgi:hypothetical protein
LGAGPHLPQPPDDQQTSAVVTAVDVAATNDPHRHRYSRSIFSRRKWVAQEMQGS